jgi:hypothetical protein
MNSAMRWFAIVLMLLAMADGRPLLAQSSDAASKSQTAKMQMLDRVLAIINEDVIFESDLQQEIRYNRFQSLPNVQQNGERKQAFSRLVSRQLILQQIQPEDKKSSEPSQKEFEESFAHFKASIPACAGGRCTTPEQWEAVVRKAGLDPAAIADRWHERLTILRFIELRFRQGITITPDEIKKEYESVWLPEFKRRKAEVVPLPLISERIQEILLQRRMNSLQQEWLKSLREQGNLEVLDPALRTSEDKSDEDGEGGA